MRLRTQCLLLCATNAAALQLQPAPQLVKRPHQQPRVILTTEQVEKLERSVAAALPAVGQWAAFGGVVSAFSGFLWGYAGLPAAALYASSVASGTAWALAWDHVMPGGGRRVAEMMGGTTVGVPCSVRDAVAKTAAAAKMPAPAAYIVPTKEPNAFAAGRGRDRVVAVTQGLVDLLDRYRPRAEIYARSRLDDVPRVDSIEASSHTTPSPPRKSRRKDTATQAGARGRRGPRSRPPQARRHGPRRASRGHALGPVDRETGGRPHAAGEQAKREIGRVRRRGPRRRGRRLVGRGAAAPSRMNPRAKSRGSRRWRGGGSLVED